MEGSMVLHPVPILSSNPGSWVPWSLRAVRGSRDREALSSWEGREERNLVQHPRERDRH